MESIVLPTSADQIRRCAAGLPLVCTMTKDHVTTNTTHFSIRVHCGMWDHNRSVMAAAQILYVIHGVYCLLGSDSCMSTYL